MSHSRSAADCPDQPMCDGCRRVALLRPDHEAVSRRLSALWSACHAAVPRAYAIRHRPRCTARYRAAVELRCWPPVMTDAPHTDENASSTDLPTPTAATLSAVEERAAPPPAVPVSPAARQSCPTGRTGVSPPRRSRAAVIVTRSARARSADARMFDLGQTAVGTVTSRWTYSTCVLPRTGAKPLVLTGMALGVIATDVASHSGQWSRSHSPTGTMPIASSSHGTPTKADTTMTTTVHNHLRSARRAPRPQVSKER